jgi:hypothetical protein
MRVRAETTTGLRLGTETAASPLVDTLSLPVMLGVFAFIAGAPVSQG